MNGSDIASLVIAIVFLAVQGAMILRLGHYVRTGRWFR